MKKFLKVFVLLVLSLTLVACGTSEDKGEAKLENTAGFDNSSLYLITDIGTIDDRNFNQGSYEGLKEYADAIGVEANYLQPTAKTKAAYLASISQAAQEGAKVIVTPGYLFEDSIYEAQTLYPDIDFILIDGEPREGEGKPASYQPNTVGIKYEEQQAGFLAGYAAVKEGFTELGYMGGMAVPAVVKYGYGFVAGAEYAAEELGVDVNVKYTYLNTFNPDPEVATKASAWYNDGIEIIFVAAGGAGNSVMSAAENANKYVIGVDIDQKEDSPTVITSAMKNLKKSVYDTMVTIGENKFEGGKLVTLDIDDDMVQLSEDFSRFKNFKEEDYKKLVDALKANENNIKTNIPTDTTASKANQLETTRVTVDLVE